MKRTSLAVGLLWAVLAQVWLLVFCLSAGRIILHVGPLNISLGREAWKMVTPLFATWLAWRAMQRGRTWPALTLLSPWLLLVGVAVLSTLTAVDPASALREAFKLAACTGLLFVLIDLPWSWRLLSGLLIAFLLGSTRNLWLVAVQHVRDMPRVEGSFGHPNVLGSYCLLALGMLSFVLFFGRQIILRIVVGATLLCLIVTIYWTASRSTYIGLLAFMGTILLLGSRRELICASVLLAALLLFAGSSSRIQERVSHTIRELQAGGMDRLTVWGLSLDILRNSQRPLGLGLGESFNLAARADPAVDADDDLRQVAHAHNLYLHILIALGPVGLFALCWIMTTMYAQVLRPIMQQYGTPFSSSPFLLAGLVGLLCQQLFDASLLRQNVLPTLVTYLAIAAVLLRLPRVEAASRGSI